MITFSRKPSTMRSEAEQVWTAVCGATCERTRQTKRHFAIRSSSSILPGYDLVVELKF